ALPLALVILLRSAPDVDARWEDRPAHFWIVLAAGVLNAALALAITEAGRRRRDARLLLIGLDASLKIVRHSRALTAAALGVIAAWAVISLNELPPLRDAITPSDATLP